MTRQEAGIESALVRGEYKDVSKAEFEDIARAVARRRKLGGDKVKSEKVRN